MNGNQLIIRKGRFVLKPWDIWEVKASLTKSFITINKPIRVRSFRGFVVETYSYKFMSVRDLGMNIKQRIIDSFPLEHITFKLYGTAL